LSENAHVALAVERKLTAGRTGGAVALTSWGFFGMHLGWAVQPQPGVLVHFRRTHVLCGRPVHLEIGGRTLSFLALGAAYACATHLLCFPLPFLFVSPHADLTTFTYFHAPSSIIALGGVPLRLQGDPEGQDCVPTLGLLARRARHHPDKLHPHHPSVVACARLHGTDPGSPSSSEERQDRFIGDLSHPAYMFTFRF
jgi:hypothetical protein